MNKKYLELTSEQIGKIKELHPDFSEDDILIDSEISIQDDSFDHAFGWEGDIDFAIEALTIMVPHGEKLIPYEIMKDEEYVSGCLFELTEKQISSVIKG